MADPEIGDVFKDITADIQTIVKGEIELAKACIVRLKGDVDPELLRSAIRAAGRLGGDWRGGD